MAKIRKIKRVKATDVTNYCNRLIADKYVTEKPILDGYEIKAVNDAVASIVGMCDYLEARLNDCPNEDQIKAINELRTIAGQSRRVLSIAAQNFDYLF